MAITNKLVTTAILLPLLFVSPSSFAQPQYGAIGDLYLENCSACHGNSLEGTPLGLGLVGVDLPNGSSIEALIKSIGTGNPEKDMPAWSGVMTPAQIQSLAIYIVEQRSGYSYDDYNIRATFELPQGIQKSERHDFALEVFAADIDPLPFSIRPIPDGRLLLSEKKRGLSIVSTDGAKSELISGTPRIFNDSTMNNDGRALDRGIGWIQDVVAHPDYASNGWIYIYYGDRCDSCNASSRENDQPASMSKIVRGRINDGEWVDEQTIWAADLSHYTILTDLIIGGRMVLDDQGYVYFTVGAKNGFYDLGIQDLATPWGKIHRVHDDGRIPEDNPFVADENALPSIWSFGHRVAQGLRYDTQTGNLWSTEHGARGGDEVNLILPGRNYGWPLTTTGVDYDGSSIQDKFDVQFDINDMQPPIVEMTPSPAISNLIVYRGSKFPKWEGDLIVGSLKANTLYRFSIEDNKPVEREVLVQGVGRIRDITLSADGDILLLTESASGGSIVRLTPSTD